MSNLGVVQPVYNVEKFVGKSVESILGQTLDDFVYVIVNDGSTDSTLRVISEFDDPRIVVIDKGHSGLADTLNSGINHLLEQRGCKYIARMDGDDISHPSRFQKQLDFMMKNPHIKISSTWAERYDKSGNLFERFAPKFKTPIELKTAMLRMNFFVHGSVMFSSDVFDKVGMYQDGLVEDFWYWMRILNEFDGAIIQEYLYELHSRSGSYTDVRANEIYNEAKRCREHWSRAWNIEIPANDYDYTESF